MTKDEIVENKADLEWADLRCTNLRWANLRNANLRWANLKSANLRWANLRWANLRLANLRDVDLRDVDLSEANLSWANLSNANLGNANLSWANLSETDLRDVDLSGVNLNKANLNGAKYSDKTKWPAPTMLLLARWGQVSDELTIELMRYDAANHPQPELFDLWRETGKCPYDNCQWGRCINFRERRDLWSPGPAKSALELTEMLLAEKLEKVNP